LGVHSFNIGSRKALSQMRITKEILFETESTSKILLLPAQPSAFVRLELNTTKAASILGFSQQVLFFFNFVVVISSKYMNI